MPATIHIRASSRKRRKEVRNFNMAMNYRWQYTKTERDINMQTERVEGTPPGPCKKEIKGTASHRGHRGHRGYNSIFLTSAFTHPRPSSLPLDAPFNGANGTQAFATLTPSRRHSRCAAIAPGMALGDRSTVRKANGACIGFQPVFCSHVERCSQGWNPISANLIKASARRMYFVP
jgi:hypothetical protein